MAYIVEASILPDGRKHLSVLNTEWPRNDYNPAHYTTVRNIDGSNRFMKDNAYWSFMDYSRNDEAEKAIASALATLPDA
jgi:hypothetical protein